MKQGMTRIMLLLILYSFVSAANAIPVNLSIQGTVDSTLGMNPFGLSVGDNVFANATFDDGLIAPIGNSTVEFGTDGNAFGSILTFTIGSITYNEFNDVDYIGDTLPGLAFRDGSFNDFDFVADAGVNGAIADFDAGGLAFSGFNAGIQNLFGTWDIDTLSITPVAPVPEPSSMVLLGLGVIGLFGAKRKKYLA